MGQSGDSILPLLAQCYTSQDNEPAGFSVGHKTLMHLSCFKDVCL